MRLAYSNRHWIISIGRFVFVATTRDKAFSFIKTQVKGGGSMEAYLHHKASAMGPFMTESVSVRESQAPRRGQTVSGYGCNLPTPYEVFWRGRWRRVKAICYGNASTLYIPSKESHKGIIEVDIRK